MDNEHLDTIKSKSGKCSMKRYMTRNTILILIAASIISYALLQFTTLSLLSLPMSVGVVVTEITPNHRQTTKENLIITSNVFTNLNLRNQMLQRKVEKLKSKFQMPRSIHVQNRNGLLPNYNVHVFYYAWYGNLKNDGAFKHWNHSYLPTWKTDDHRVYPTGYHGPPIDVASNYYPSLGCYSSRDPHVMRTHLRQMRDSGIGVLVLSWTPPNYPDSPDPFMEKLFDTATEFDVKIALHIEPYAARHPANLKSYLRDFLLRFGQHPALYKSRKTQGGDKELPVFYVYDSYLIPEFAWRDLLSRKGKLTIRDTDMDGIFLGLLVDLNHRIHIKKSHFDGFYTYFAINGFSYGSTWKNWKNLSRYAKQNDLIFVPSVGPGYIDTNIRPWNALNTRHRRHGQYYDVAWRTALSSGSSYVSITSFNEWHEGTQIEAAQSKTHDQFTYMDYEPEGSMFYMNLTQFWLEQFEKVLKLGVYQE